MTTVATSRHTANASNVFYTSPRGGVIYPTGTWVVKIPAPHALSGLAGFLAANIDNTSNHRGIRVRAYNDRITEAELMRDMARTQYVANGVRYSGANAEARALHHD